MKVGLSFSRCLLDIFEGKVAYEDVLVIIARTKFHPLNDGDWEDIWAGYTNRQSAFNNPEWADYRDNELEFKELVQRLHVDGKLHQPRMTGGVPVRRKEIWLETFLPPTELEKNPAVKEAWEQFQIVAGLSSVRIDKEYN
jgi:hypothetical protein